jgi:RNA polymerase sigma-70 factor (ECF subfamily)
MNHPSRQSTAEECAQCAARKGCRECFEELVRRYQTPLLHFLIRRAGSRQDAEDLVQETFLLAYRHLERYQPRWRFSTWLFTIAHRQAASARRRKPLVLQAAAQTGGADPAVQAEEAEWRSGLWDAARRILEPDAFTALWLCYVESMTAEEIGQVLARSANAVRILLYRARGQLKAAL